MANPNTDKNTSNRGNGALHEYITPPKQGESLSTDSILDFSKIEKSIEGVMKSVVASSRSSLKVFSDYVKENPIGSVAFAFAAGAMGGSLLTYSMRRFSGSRDDSKHES